MTGLIFHLNEWKGLCYDSPDALSIFAPQMEQSWHFIMICRPPGSPPKHSGCMLGLWQDDCLSRVAAELMFLLRHWVNRLIHANMKASEEAQDVCTGFDRMRCSSHVVAKVHQQCFDYWPPSPPHQHSSVRLQKRRMNVCWCGHTNANTIF